MRLAPEDQGAVLDSALKLQNRIGSLPPDFVRDNPYTAGLFAISNISSDTLARMGASLGDGWPWIRSRGGPGGAFLGMKAMALSDPDAAVARAKYLNAQATIGSQDYGRALAGVNAEPSTSGLTPQQ